MTLSLVQDASDPTGIPLQAGVLVTAGYIGGDTPHVWTDTDWQVWNTPYRIPIWVRSNPAQVDPATDANNCVAALAAIGAPPPYLVLPYGSRSTLFQNPREDGWWLAAPDGVAELTGDVGEVAKQFRWTTGYDLSVIDQSIPTWNVQAGTGPTAVMLDLETAVGDTYDPVFTQILHAVPGPKSWLVQVNADLNEILADVSQIQSLIGQNIT